MADTSGAHGGSSSQGQQQKQSEMSYFGDDNSASSQILALVSKLGPPEGEQAGILLPDGYWNCTSKWKVKSTIRFDGQLVETDLLHAMKVDKQFISWKDLFELEVVKFMLPYMDIQIDGAELEFMRILMEDLQFSVPEWGALGESPGCAPASGIGNAFAGYHIGRIYQQSRILEGILRDKQTVIAKLREKFTKWPWALQLRVQSVQRFFETLIKFLATQQDALEGAYEDLFVAFCSMVGLHLNRGGNLRDRKMQVFGHEVTSRTDLRAIERFMRHWESEPETLPRLNTLLVVKVKPTVPSQAKTDSARKNTTRVPADSTTDCASNEDHAVKAFAHMEQHLGQIFGEMLAELPNRADSRFMFGICVQGSRVQLLFLRANYALLNFIGCDGSRESLQQHENCTRGTLYITEPKDFMQYEQRKDILHFLRKFGTASASG